MKRLKEVSIKILKTIWVIMPLIIIAILLWAGTYIPD